MAANIREIVLVQGYPDQDRSHFGRALMDACAAGLRTVRELGAEAR